MSTQTLLPRVITLRPIRSTSEPVPRPPSSPAWSDAVKTVAVMIVSAVVVLAPLAPTPFRHAPRLIVVGLVIAAARGLFAHMDGRVARRSGAVAAVCAFGVLALDVFASWLLGGAW